jgi:hypothetical protein
MLTIVNQSVQEFVLKLPVDVVGVDYQKDIFYLTKPDKSSFPGGFACFLLSYFR